MKNADNAYHHIQLNLKKDLDEIIKKLADDEDRTPSMMCLRLIKEALKARNIIGGETK